MSEYDEQDQAYQDLLEEADAYREQLDKMRDLITEICDLIYYQVHLKHQDAWLQRCVSEGLYTIEEDK